MGDPEISVVVPAYNAEPWIAETLSSILKQSFPSERYEIIVVDNCSDDRTREIALCRLANSPARATVAQERQRGPAHARNHGLSSARGEWVQFLDADDVLCSDKLARQYQCARNSTPRTGLIYSAWQHLEVGERGTWKRGPARVPSLDNTNVSSLVRSLLSSDGFVPTGSQLIRRSALLDVGGYRDVGLIEDVDLHIRLATAGWQFAYCPSSEPLFAYRRRSAGSASTSDQAAFADGVARNAGMAEAWARAHDTLDDLLSSRIVDCYFQAARSLAGHDWSRFERVVEQIERVAGRARPSSPLPLAIASKLVGYRAAERVAVAWRAMKGGRAGHPK